MALWIYQFNLDEAEVRQEDKNVVKKYAFSSVITISFQTFAHFFQPFILFLPYASVILQTILFVFTGAAYS
jgi:hypothetical protein